VKFCDSLSHMSAVREGSDTLYTIIGGLLKLTENSIETK